MLKAACCSRQSVGRDRGHACRVDVNVLRLRSRRSRALTIAMTNDVVARAKASSTCINHGICSERTYVHVLSSFYLPSFSFFFPYLSAFCFCFPDCRLLLCLGFLPFLYIFLSIPWYTICDSLQFNRLTMPLEQTIARRNITSIYLIIRMENNLTHRHHLFCYT